MREIIIMFPLQAELKGYSVDNFERLEEMRDKVDTLRSAREEKRKNVCLLLVYMLPRIADTRIKLISGRRI